LILNRYIRQINLPFIGNEGQEKLKNASVLVVGAGGLGCPVLTTLVSAGIGCMGIVDFDVVSSSNLHRQWIYTENQVGKSKAKCAAEFLQARNSDCEVIAFDLAVNTDNIFDIITNFDLVVDASDNFATRFLINDACCLVGKPLVFGAVYRNEGQVSLFNFTTDQKNFGPNYRDIVSEMPDNNVIPDCEVAGVLPTITGIIGNMQAAEVIMTILGKPQLNGFMAMISQSGLEVSLVKIEKDKKNLISNLKITESLQKSLDRIYTKLNSIENMIQECTVLELKQMLDNGENIILIDVREPNEFEIAHINGTLIPLSEIQERWNEIPEEGKVVIHCRSGVRSANAIRFLQEQHGYSNLTNLKGGILAWSAEIDQSIQKY
jgi:sulfur-carrier protein adenylyltransferase/sulfurtransferase